MSGLFYNPSEVEKGGFFNMVDPGVLDRKSPYFGHFSV